TAAAAPSTSPMAPAAPAAGYPEDGIGLSALGSSSPAPAAAPPPKKSGAPHRLALPRMARPASRSPETPQGAPPHPQVPPGGPARGGRNRSARADHPTRARRVQRHRQPAARGTRDPLATAPTAARHRVGMAAQFDAAHAACELPDWRDQAALLDLIQQKIDTE